MSGSGGVSGSCGVSCGAIGDSRVVVAGRRREMVLKSLNKFVESVAGHPRPVETETETETGAL